MNLDDVRAGIEVVSERVAQDVASRDHLTEPRNEELDERSFAGRERDRARTDLHDRVTRHELDIPHTQHAPRCRFRTSQCGAQTREELFENERFDEVVIGTPVERAQALLDRVARCEHEDRHVAVTSNVRDHALPVAIGKTEIEHDRSQPAGCETRESLLRVADRLGDEAFLTQPSYQARSETRFVFNDQNRHAHESGPSSSRLHLRDLGPSYGSRMRLLAVSFVLIAACGSSPPKQQAPAHESDERDEHEEKIALDDVPAAVTQAVMARYPDAKLHKAERVTNADRSVAYELGFETAAGWKEATFKPDGTFVEEE